MTDNTSSRDNPPRARLTSRERQTTTSRKPSFTESDIEHFEKSLAGLIQSPQYSLLEDLSLSFFLPDKALPKGLSHLTVGGLCDLTPHEILTTKGLSAKRIQRLTTLLEQLSERSIDELPSSIEDSIPAQMEEPSFSLGTLGRVQHQPTTQTENPQLLRKQMLSSVEAELVLSRAFEQLRASPHFETVRHHRIEKYWPKEAFRAPFLESLTVNQLMNMGLKNILEKRTVTEQKIIILADLMNELAENNDTTGGQTIPSIEKVPVQTKGETLSIAQRGEIPPDVCNEDTVFPWKKDSSLTFHQHAIFYWFHSEWEKAVEHPHGLAQIVKLLPEHLTFQAFYDSVAALEERQESRDALPSSSRELLRLAEAAIPELLHSYRIALESPAVAEETLLRNLELHQFDPRFVALIQRLIVWALGGTAPVICEEPLIGYFTRVPGLLETLLRTQESTTKQLCADLLRPEDLVRCYERILSRS